MDPNEIWKCLKCGECCKLFVRTGVNISEKEFWKIEKFARRNFNLDVIEKLTSAYSETHTLPITNSGIPRTCIFLKRNLCIIHAVKPSACRNYPLEIQEPKNKVEIHVSFDCSRGEKIAEKLKIGKLPAWLKNRAKRKQVKIHLRSFYEEKVKEVLGEE